MFLDAQRTLNDFPLYAILLDSVCARVLHSCSVNATLRDGWGEVRESPHHGNSDTFHTQTKMPADFNPYETPRAAPVSREDPDVAAPRGGWWRVVSLAGYSVVSACGGFLGWCLLDYLYVRVFPYPTPPDKLDGLLLLFPIAVFAGGLAWFRSDSTATRLILTGIAVVLSFVLATVLILFLGISFHLTLGGTL